MEWTSTRASPLPIRPNELHCHAPQQCNPSFVGFTLTADTFAELAAPHVLQDAWDLLSRCLEVDPARRLSAAQALQHSFLRD